MDVISLPHESVIGSILITSNIYPYKHVSLLCNLRTLLFNGCHKKYKKGCKACQYTWIYNLRQVQTNYEPLHTHSGAETGLAHTVFAFPNPLPKRTPLGAFRPISKYAINRNFDT